MSHGGHIPIKFDGIEGPAPTAKGAFWRGPRQRSSHQIWWDWGSPRRCYGRHVTLEAEFLFRWRSLYKKAWKRHPKGPFGTPSGPHCSIKLGTFSNVKLHWFFDWFFNGFGVDFGRLLGSKIAFFSIFFLIIFWLHFWIVFFWFFVDFGSFEIFKIAVFLKKSNNFYRIAVFHFIAKFCPKMPVLRIQDQTKSKQI